MTLEQIAEKLNDAGCITRISGDKCHIDKTPNGGRGRYGYVIAGTDYRDITEHVTVRQGEIRQIINRA